METNPLRGGRHIGFRFAGRRSPLEIVDRRGLRVAAHPSPGAAPWYARHLERDNEIHEIIKDSHYAKDIVVEGGVASAKIGAATTVGLAWGVGGVAVGAVLLRAAIEASSSEGAALAVSIAVGGISKGVETARSGYRESTRTLEERLDPSPGYRYVRFLPDYFWLAWTDAPVEYPVLLRLPDWQHGNLRPVPGTRPPVTIGFLPDVDPYANVTRPAPRYQGY